MRVRNYEQDDIKRIEVKEIFKSSICRMEKVIDDIRKNEDNGIYTFHSDGDIVGIVGITHMWPGVAEVWSILSEKSKDFPITLHRNVLDLLNVYQEDYNMHRFQLTVLKGFEEGYKWANALGFKAEAIMVKYDASGNDHILFARTH